MQQDENAASKAKRRIQGRAPQAIARPRRPQTLAQTWLQTTEQRNTEPAVLRPRTMLYALARSLRASRGRWFQAAPNRLIQPHWSVGIRRYRARLGYPRAAPTRVPHRDERQKDRAKKKPQIHRH